MRYVFLMLVAALLASPAMAQKPDKYKEPEKYRAWREELLPEKQRKMIQEKKKVPVFAEGFRQITVDGIVRNYLFRAPQPQTLSDTAPAAPAKAPETRKALPPLLVVIPGAKGTRDSVSLGPIPETAQAAGRAVVFLETTAGALGIWNDGRAGTIFKDRNGKVTDDMAYFNAVVSEIAALGLADTSKIFIAGIGSGSIFAQRIVCRGEAPVMGAMFFLATTPAPFAESCARKKPLSLLLVHATKDALFPFDGGRPSDLPPVAAGATPMMSGEEAAGFWRKFAGCGAKSSDLSPTDAKPDDGMSVLHTRFDGCDGKKTLDWIKIDGAGHNLPLGARGLMIGKGAEEMFAPRNYDFDVSLAAEDFMKRAGGK